MLMKVILVKYEVASEKRKRALADSLKKFMTTKPFSKITINDIISDCNVNRKTFYYHFDDIYALLKWTLEQEAIEIVKKFNLMTESDDAIQFVKNYVKENEKMLKNVCHSIGRDELKRFFYTDFYDVVRSVIENSADEENIVISDDYKDFLCRFYTEAIAGTLLAWISEEEAMSDQQISHYTSKSLKAAIFASLRAYASGEIE